MASSISRSETGAATLVLLATLPFLLAILFTTVGLFMVLRTNSEAVHLCRTTLLEVEQDRLDAAARLIKLNPKAKVLRSLRAAADNALKIALATGIPQAIALARATQALVHASQIAFSVVQLGILNGANFNTHQKMAALKRELKSLHRTDAELYEGNSERVISSIASELNTLAVERKQKNTLTPDYDVRSDFKTRQYIRVRWNLSPARLAPRWMGFVATHSNLKIESRCSTTAEQKGHKQWRAVLAADKRLLSLW